MNSGQVLRGQGEYFYSSHRDSPRGQNPPGGRTVGMGQAFSAMSLRAGQPPCFSAGPGAVVWPAPLSLTLRPGLTGVLHPSPELARGRATQQPSSSHPARQLWAQTSVSLLCPSRLEAIPWLLQAVVRIMNPKVWRNPKVLGEHCLGREWGLREEGQNRTRGRGSWPGGRERPLSQRTPHSPSPEASPHLFICPVTRLLWQSQAGAAAAQAEVSKRRSIMSPTCSTRYLMYFSGFLVKGTLPYLLRKAP